MITETTPLSTLLAINKMKYKSAIIAFLLVVLSFVLNAYMENSYSQYIALAGLAYYLFILLIYSVNKSVPISDDENSLLAPINGKVADITNENGKTSITIVKHFFNAADIRRVHSADEIEFKKNRVDAQNSENEFFWSVKGNVGNLLTETNKAETKASLIGISVGSGTCRFEFPAGYDCYIQKGDKVIAGETIIGRIL